MLESATRKFIDDKLLKQNRDIKNHNQVIEEYPINWGFADYVLLDTDGSIIAVIEAKKFHKNPRDWQFQAIEYAENISKKQWYTPFVFLANGKEIYFLNLNQPTTPRKVKTFFTISDLRRIKELTKILKPAWKEKVDNDIAGRYYQIEAIKRVCEWVDQWKRKFLLVMATGTWKTRTAMWIIDNLFRSHHAQKVLFLCDRTALRDQAFDDGFKAFFESTPKTKIETWKTDDNARLYSATYQTMINYLDRFSSGYFDLIIVDEVHRSVYWQWHDILEHFDAIKVWLTATPVEFVDRNTYKIFWCEEQEPTYYYGLNEAIEDDYLVPYTVLMARTQFQIQWIKWKTLPPDLKEQLIKEWKDPEQYNFEWEEIWKKINNKDTNRAVVREFMEQSYKIEDGLPWKSIIFAMNQAHAENLQLAFEELYPNLPDFSVVITSNVERSDQLLRDFKRFKTEKKFRVAISVDMLDTGVDVPSIVNLVFAKKVFSESKFWQMVGRWTRLAPDVYGPWEDKDDFLIIDFAMNFDEEHTFKQAPWKQLSLQQKYFEELIEHLRLYENRQDKQNYEQTKKHIIKLIQSLPENDDIFSQKELIDEILSWKIWDNITINPREKLQKLAPYMRHLNLYSIDELKFLIKTEKFINLQLQDKDIETLKNSIASDINALSSNISKVKDKQDNIDKVLSADFWEDITTKDIKNIQANFTNLMKYKKPNIPDIIVSDIKDKVVERKWISYWEWKQMKSDQYWEKFVNSIQEKAESNHIIQKLLNNEDITEQEQRELEGIFKSMEYHFTTTNLNKVYNCITTDFLDMLKFALHKQDLPDWKEQVDEVFQGFIQENNFNSNQIRFLQIVKSLLIQKKTITLPDDFYSPIFENQFGMWAFDRLFKEEDLEKIQEFVGKFEV